MMRHGVLLATAVCAVLACDPSAGTRVLEIEATGAVTGLVFFDVDGDRSLGGADRLLEGIRLHLVVEGTADTLAKASTDAQGQYRIGAPVGTYRLAIDPADLGDSIRVVTAQVGGLTLAADSAVTMTVAAGDTVVASVGLSYPTYSVAELRERPVGEKAFVEGIALTARSAFGDTTQHLAGSAMAIRATRVRPGQFETLTGDTLRFLGRRSMRAGQPTLDDVSWFFLGTTDVPPPDSIATSAAAEADQGRLDATLVRIRGTVADTATENGDLVVRIDDGSGMVAVVLDRDVAFDPAGIAPGASLGAVGVLVPIPGGEGIWRVKPRFQSDLDVA